MVNRVITKRGSELVISGLITKKILISRKGGVVLRNVNLDRVESKIVSRELGCVPSKWDEVSNASRLLSNLK